MVFKENEINTIKIFLNLKEIQDKSSFTMKTFVSLQHYLILEGFVVL